MSEVKNSPAQEVILQQLATAFSAIPFNKMLGLNLNKLDKNHVIMSFEMKDTLIGNFLHGILHGGVISSVLDMAGGMVVMSAAIHKHSESSADDLVKIISKTSTIDLQISYLRPGKGSLFTAKAFLIKSGKNISFARMELFNETNELLATGNGTYTLSNR